MFNCLSHQKRWCERGGENKAPLLVSTGDSETMMLCSPGNKTKQRSSSKDWILLTRPPYLASSHLVSSGQSQGNFQENVNTSRHKRNPPSLNQWKVLNHSKICGRRVNRKKLFVIYFCEHQVMALNMYTHDKCFSQNSGKMQQWVKRQCRLIPQNMWWEHLNTPVKPRAL